MQIAIGSIFRNAAGHVQRYADQIAALRRAAPDNVIRPVLVEGDSGDNTWERLNELFPGCVERRNHGGPSYGSVDSVQRYKQFSFCYEGVLERLTPEDDVFVYVEGDLIFDPLTIYGLIEHLQKPGVDMVAPFISFQKRHYDTWAFRGMDGKNLGLFPPYHVELLEDSPTGLYELSSAGSCIVMKGEVARRAHLVPAELCVVGLCWSARKLGYRLWFEPKLKVYHPE